MKIAAVLGVFLCLFLASTASAGILRVDRDASGLGNGSGWADAFPTLNAALAAAVSGDEIWIAEGTYRPNDSAPSNLDPAQWFQLKNGVAVRGGFAGTETSTSQRISGANPVILSGDLLDDDQDGDGDGFPDESTMADNTWHVFYHSSTPALDSTALLDSVTIRGGNAGGDYPHYRGGGMLNSSCAPTLTNCVFTGNRALREGAGMANRYAHPALVDCTFEGNSANYKGGAVFNDDSNPSVTNCTFARNAAGRGGAVANEDSLPVFTNCTFNENTTTSGGAGVYNDNSDIVLVNCTFAGNTAGGSGGAIDNYGSDPFATNCIFWNNSPDVFDDTRTTVTHSVVEGGYASGTAIVTDDPLLMPLGDYGGTTPTMPIAFSSPAADAGTTGAGVPASDQRGFARLAPPDIGACELQSVPATVVFTTIEGVTTYAEGAQTTLVAQSEGIDLTWSWYQGNTGDESVPLGTTSVPSFALAPLTASSPYWVKISYSGGSLNSSTLALTVASPVIRVALTGDDGNDGTSWLLAKRTISAALDGTGYGGEVWIAGGTYHPNDADPSNRDPDQWFQLKNGVALRGGFAGTESSAAQRIQGANVVILSGDLFDDDQDENGDGFTDAATMADNTWHVFYHPNALALGSSTLLESVTIRGGNAVGVSPHDSGGGMWNEACSPTLRQCVLTGNRASGNGAALSNDRANPSLTDCTFEDNESEGHGGAIWNSTSNPATTHCAFIHNAASGSYAYGGAIYNNNAIPTIANCTFSGNFAFSGGALYILSSSDIALMNCTFTQNFAASSGGGGSAIHSNGGGVPLVTNCIFWDNFPAPFNNTLATVTHSVVEGGYVGGTAIVTDDPLLLPLGNYGGTTPTIPVSSGSPAFNAGTTGTGVPVDDQRGFARDAQPDIGACELQSVPATAILKTAENVTNYAPGFETTLVALSEGTGLTWSWYQGISGDESTLLGNTVSPSFALAPLSASSPYWVKVSYSGGSLDSPTLSLTVVPAVIHVTVAGNDGNDGSSWALAKRTVSAALDGAGYGGEIWVAEGTYRPNDADPSNLDPTQSFRLKNGITVRGGFEGVESDPAERFPGSHPVFLSGDLAGDDADGDGDGLPDNATRTDNCLRVFDHPFSLGLDASAVLDSVTVRGGEASGEDGGGMRNVGCSPTVINCTFTWNRAQYAAAVYNEMTEASFVNCTFASNWATASGGAVLNSGGHTTWTNCTFTANAATSSGGGIYTSFAGDPSTIENCIFWGNTPNQIYGNNSVSNSVVEGGFASGTGIITADPLLLPLGFYGGPTPTSPLAESSPAQDAGLTGFHIPANDQRGVARDGLPDIGSCEIQGSPTTVILTTLEGETHFTSFYPPTLVAWADGDNLTYSWYAGFSGDESSLLATGPANSFTLPSFSADLPVWVQVSYSGGTIDSDTLNLILAPSVIHLSPLGDDANDGASWAAAVRSLTVALNTAARGAQIWIVEGTYFVNDADPANDDRTQTFRLKNLISVYGGFAGTESAVGERDADAHPVILSGDLLRNDADGDGDGKPDAATIADNAWHVFRHPAVLELDASATVDSVTVTAGNADGYSGYDHGGAMRNENASPSVSHCVFTGNFGKVGAAVSNLNGSPVFTDCSFLDNEASSRGGALYNDASTAIFTNCTFTDNTSKSSAAGAVFNHDATPQFLNCTFVGNTAESNYGGAVYNDDSDSVFLHCTIAENSSSYGAAIDNSSSSNPILTNTILWNNTPAHLSGGTPVVSHCVIEGDFPEGTSVISGDPLLLPLGHYGGPTQTMPITAGSAALNAGSNDPSLPTEDQRGFPRDATPDIGACEFQEIPWTLILVTVEGSTDFILDYQPTLRAYSEGTILSYQWFAGETGDESQLLGVTTVPEFQLPPLTADNFFWVRGSFTGGSVDSETILLTVTSAPPVIHVTISGDDANSGATWATAKRTIPSAIEVAYPGAEVWIKAGTYYTNDADPSDTSKEQSFQLKNHVAVMGGFGGFETSAQQRNPDLHQTVLSGDLLHDDADTDGDGTIDNRIENTNHIFHNTELDTSAVLDGVTIEGAWASGTSAHVDVYGGGIYNNRASPTIRDCIFFDNYARTYHGVAYGGAVCNLDSQPIFERCTFLDNETYGFDGYYGGAVFNSASNATFRDCSFSNNSAERGGAVLNSNSEATFVNCSFTGNRAVGFQDAQAGAVYNSVANSIFTNCTFYNNYSDSHGGAMSNSICDPIITNCTFHENEAGGDGGAIYNGASFPVITHCTISGNISNYLHIIIPQIPRDPKITYYIGGIANTSSVPVLKNCILWGNRGRQISGSGATISDCIIEGGYAGTNVSTANPLLTTFGNHGGPTQTIPVAYGSPAINTGASGAGIPDTDQRGMPRTGAPDLGACEFTAFAVDAPDFDPYAVLGTSAWLQGISDHASPSFQWYQGASGDTSTPIGTGSEHTTPPLEFGTRIWVRLSSAATGALDSDTVEIPVRGTYADWCAHHNLTGAAANPAAAPAGDDIANLLKFVTGLNPNQRGQLPVTIGIAPGSGQFDCTATLSKTPLDTETGFYFSNNLEMWNTPASASVMIDAGPAFQTLTLSEPVSGTAAFMRFHAHLDDSVE